MNICRVYGVFIKFKQMGKFKEFYLNKYKLQNIQVKAWLQQKMYLDLKQDYREYEEHRNAYEIGYSAGQGNNIYLTFGSNKTNPIDAEDSYKRYAMAMKHYNENLCNKESFITGYKSGKKSKL